MAETLKWSHPCYSWDGKNIVVLGAFRNNFVISFFKGALLTDPAQVLELPGENSQTGRVIRLKSVDEVQQLS